MRLLLALSSLVAFALIEANPDVGSESDSISCPSLRHELPSSQQVERSKCERGSSQLPSAAGTFSQTSTKLLLMKHDDIIHNENQPNLLINVYHQTIDARLADLNYLMSQRALVNVHHYKFDSGNPDMDSLNIKLVSGSRVHDDSCRRHLRQMLELLDQQKAKVGQMRNGTNLMSEHKLGENHFRLARVLDAFGRYESGQLEGRLSSLGVYEQCIRTPVLLGDDRQRVESRYCWAHLKLGQHLSKPLEEVSALHQGDFAFHLAICLPATCHSISFAHDRENLLMVQRLVDSQNLLPGSSYIAESLPLESVFCLVDKDSDFAAMSLGGKLLIVFATFWLFMCLYATIRFWARAELMKRNNIMNQLNLRESWRDLSRKSKESRSLVCLDSLNCMEIISCSFVFLVHSEIIRSSTAATPGHPDNSLAASLLVVPSLLMVDSFLVIVWMRTTYILLGKLSATDESHKHPLKPSFYLIWFQISSRLYLGLAPIYLLVFWFKKTVYVSLGSGPLWDFGLNKATAIGGCRNEAWFSPLAPVATSRPILSQCLPQSWLISNQLLLTLTMPPMIILLKDRFKLACVSGSLIALANIVHSYSTFSNSTPGIRIGLERLDPRAILEVLKTESFIYTIPYYRVPVAIVGVFSGYALYKLETSALDQTLPNPLDELNMRVSWPNWFRKFATQNSLIYIGITLVMMIFMNDISENASESIKSVLMKNFVLSGHLNWAISNAVLFMRLSTDWRENHLTRLARGRPCQMARRLIFVSTLLHWDILTYGPLTSTQPYSWTLSKVMSSACLTMLPLSVLAYVLIERPATKLIRAVSNTAY